MMELTKVNELYDQWLTGDGVFTDLNAYDVPWKSEDATENATIIKSLNFAYHGNHSGDKNVSPVVHKFIKDEVTTPRAKLADTLFIMYGDKWTRLWDAMHAEYNPIENYDLHEVETPAEVTHTITPAETTTTETPAETTRTITPAETTTTETPAETTKTITPAETTDTTKPAKTVSENEVSAFNSSDYVDNMKTTTTGDSNDKGTSVFTVDTAGSESVDVDTAGNTKIEVDAAGSEKVEVDTAGNTKIEVDTAGSEKVEVDTAGNTKVEVDAAGSDVFTVQNDRELYRHGNIGIQSATDLLKREIELRQWNYFNGVFNDIDTLLTLSIY